MWPFDGRVRDRLHDARQAAVSVITSPDVSIWQIVGGVWGVVDVFGPNLLFLVVYVAVGDVIPAIGVALAMSLALVIARLISGQSIRRVLGGAILVGVSGGLAVTSGYEADFYLLQVLRSAVLAAVLVISMVIRRPLVGVIVGPVIGGESWRKDPGLLRAYWQCTAIWAVVAVVRTVIKVPLYASNNVVALGIAHLITGIPLFAGMTYWQLRILRGAYAVRAVV